MELWCRRGKMLVRNVSRSEVRSPHNAPGTTSSLTQALFEPGDSSKHKRTAAFANRWQQGDRIEARHSFEASAVSKEYMINFSYTVPVHPQGLASTSWSATWSANSVLLLSHLDPVPSGPESSVELA
ncbi:hypothetical protein DL546_007612 [Coniochaeta pulveracea]|uniref:Uncharacterized protein n=1 Tax=Coniochaeta pulveracea TaxID=177199 RepID=A0A420Y9S7_9PEZI|nr:hypothetical protein DL546_007612 [Coniochaeta pulveracea]